MLVGMVMVITLTRMGPHAESKQTQTEAALLLCPKNIKEELSYYQVVAKMACRKLRLI